MAVQVWDTSALKVKYDTIRGTVPCDCCTTLDVCTDCSDYADSYDITISDVANCGDCRDITYGATKSFDFSNLDLASYINATHTVPRISPCVWRKDITLANEPVYLYDTTGCTGILLITAEAKTFSLYFTRTTIRTEFVGSLVLRDSVFPYPLILSGNLISTAHRNPSSQECICVGSFTRRDSCSWESGGAYAIVDLSSMSWSVA